MTDTIEEIRARHALHDIDRTRLANHRRYAEAHADRAALLARVAELEGEVADLKQTVIAFAGPAAARYALDAGFAKGELHPTHYDTLEKCGARMVDFKRGEISRATRKETP